MGIAEDAKSTVTEGIKRVERAVGDTVNRASDSIDAVKAGAAVKKAEADQASVKANNAAKEALRKS